MAGLSRYNANENDSGVKNNILVNKLNISDQIKLGDTESVLLSDTYDHFGKKLQQGEIQFDLSLLFDIHSYFLGTLYSWAGKIRTVDISKGNTFFIPSQYINNGLEELKKIILTNTPTKDDTKRTVAQKLALIHCEFNAIHPFREGNGRTIRLFLDLFAVNAGYDLINFSKFDEGDYIKACIDGMKMEYKKMENLLYSGLKKQ